MDTTYIWKYGNYEHELDMQNCETAKRFDEAFQSMKSKADKLNPNGKLHEILGCYCEAVYAFFDGIFGEGASGEIFSDTMNARDCTSAYESILEYVSEQSGKDTAQRYNLIERFSKNRAQRRAK